jgi:hypothetical protein
METALDTLPKSAACGTIYDIGGVVQYLAPFLGSPTTTDEIETARERVRRMIQRGDVKAIRIGNRLHVSQTSLDDFIANGGTARKSRSTRRRDHDDAAA